MSDNVFFASKSLSARLTADDLAKQSGTSEKSDYTVPVSGLIESTVHFESASLICSVEQCEITEGLNSISFYMGSRSEMIQRFSNKDKIFEVVLNDEIGDPLVTFDVAEKKYDVIITKCKDDLNYLLKLIFN